MRGFAALVASAVALLIGMVALSTSASQVTTNTTTGNETAELLEGVSTGWATVLGERLPYLAVVSLTVLGMGVLVLASRGR